MDVEAPRAIRGARPARRPHRHPATFGFEANPIKVDGVMYISGRDDYLWALDVATGEMLRQVGYPVPLEPDDRRIRWHHQWTPHDVWDDDGVKENVRFDQEGRTLLGHFEENGYFSPLDRTDGRFVRATTFGRATWGRLTQ